MEISIFRVRFPETRTVGQLYIDGTLFCFTLEDRVREIAGKPVKNWKVQNETAIPSGKYEIILQDSPRFGPDTLTIPRVEGFQGIRIHSGNNEGNTEGCIILGYRLNDDGTIKYGTTKPAVADLKVKIKKALQEGQKINLMIANMR